MNVENPEEAVRLALAAVAMHALLSDKDLWQANTLVATAFSIADAMLAEADKPR